MFLMSIESHRDLIELKLLRSKFCARNVSEWEECIGKLKAYFIIFSSNTTRQGQDGWSCQQTRMSFTAGNSAILFYSEIDSDITAQ